MTSLFHLSLFSSILLFVAFGAVLYLLAGVVLHRIAHATKGNPYAFPIGAFTGTIATAWALSLGFVAADIWALNAQADRAMSSERSAIQRLIGNADAGVLNVPALTAAAEEYRVNVIVDEWQTNHNLHPATSVEQSLQKMRTIIMQIAKSDAPPVIVNQTVGIFDSLQDARNTRIALSNTTVDQYKWYMLLSLTLLTTFTVALVHADRVKAGKKALLLYTMTATICLWILVIHANPYTGVEQISSSSLSSNYTPG